MATLDELVVRIKADVSDLEKGMRRAQVSVQSGSRGMQSAVNGLGAAFRNLVPALSIAALVQFGKSALAQADHINDLAQRIGFAGSTLSALNIPLRKAGSNLDEFSGSLVRLNNMLGEAAKGANQEAVKAFDSLGLSVANLLEMTDEQRFFAVADALMKIEDQSKLTEAGMNLFGRSFAVLIPMLRQAEGGMEEFVEQQKRAGNALSEEDLKRIDELGDSWTEAIEQMKLSFTAFIPILEAVTQGLKALSVLNPVNLGSEAGQWIGGQIRDRGLENGATRRRPDTMSLDEMQDSINRQMIAKGLVSNPAAGSNKGLLKDPRAKEIERATKAYKDYLQALEDENYLLHINEKERVGVKALMEAQNLALEAHIEISEEDREKILGMASANEALSESMAEASRFAKELKDKLSDGLAEIAMGFDGATDSAKRFAEQIAKTILERKITGPLADSLISGIDSFDFGGGGEGGGFLSGISDFFGGFFADGGRPPMGKVSMVGEDGPELFVPDTAGTIIPNGASMGGGISVSNTFQIGGGVSRAELLSLIPVIEQRTRQSVFAAIERGGPEAKIVGRRS
jgi:hypothetical protein